MTLKRQSTKNSESNLKEQDFDFKLKLLMLGNSRAGKSSFVIRYTENFFTENTPFALGVDFRPKAVVRNDKKIKLHIWDTGKVFCRLLLSFFPAAFTQKNI